MSSLAPPSAHPITELRQFCAEVLAPLGRRVPDPLHPDLHVIDDLGFDSLELYQFQVVLEELCGHELPDELVDQIDRLGTAFEWYQVKAGQGDRSGAAVTPPPPTGSPGRVRMATRRVRLRPVAPPDYEWLYDLTTRDEHLVRWRDRGQTFRIEEWVDRLWAGVAAQFVATRADGTPIGLVSLYHHDARNRHARLAIIFDDATSSPGWRLEAVGLLLDYAFEVYDLLKVYAEVIEFNLASFSSGLDDLFVEEGRLLDYEYAHGRHWAVHILAISQARFVAYRDQWLPRSLGPGVSPSQAAADRSPT